MLFFAPRHDGVFVRGISVGARGGAFAGMYGGAFAGLSVYSGILLPIFPEKPSDPFADAVAFYLEDSLPDAACSGAVRHACHGGGGGLRGGALLCAVLCDRKCGGAGGRGGGFHAAAVSGCDCGRCTESGDDDRSGGIRHYGASGVRDPEDEHQLFQGDIRFGGDAGGHRYSSCGRFDVRCEFRHRLRSSRQHRRGCAGAFDAVLSLQSGLCAHGKSAV